MADQKDVIAVRLARTELTKRGIDISRADVHAMHGIVTMRGIMTVIPGTGIQDLETELHHVARNLRQRQEIREVVMEITLPTGLKRL